VDVDRRVLTDQEIKTLFGRSLRVHLALWIVSSGSQGFRLSAAMDAMYALGEARSGTATELDRFVRVGLLLRSGEASSVSYFPRASPLWTAFFSIAQACGLTQEPSLPSSWDPI
jgi:hypothetical protein